MAGTAAAPGTLSTVTKPADNGQLAGHSDESAAGGGPRRESVLRAYHAANREQRRKRRLDHSSWRQVADTRIRRLRVMATIAQARGEGARGAVLEQAIYLLNKAEHVLTDQPESLSTWWNGSLRDQVWREIHQGEALIVSQLPDEELGRRMAEIRYDARLILDPGDPIMTMVAADAGTRRPEDAPDMADGARRALAHELVRRYREAWDDRYTRSRSFRNRLIVLTAMVAAAVAVLVAAGWLGLIWLELPKTTPPHAIFAPRLDHLLAMLALAVLGAVGGLISGSGEVVKVGGVYNPFSLPWYLLFVKIPMGALTGILGVLAIRGDLVPDMKIAMSNWSQVVIWALIFGASQQLITFMVDRRVKSLTTSTPQEQVVNK